MCAPPTPTRFATAATASEKREARPPLDATFGSAGGAARRHESLLEGAVRLEGSSRVEGAVEPDGDEQRVASEAEHDEDGIDHRRRRLRVASGGEARLKREQTYT